MRTERLRWWLAGCLLSGSLASAPVTSRAEEPADSSQSVPSPFEPVAQVEPGAEWWKHVANNPPPANRLAWFLCPSHPRESWGLTVGGNRFGVDVFTQHSVIWLGGTDLRLPVTLTARRFGLGALLVGLAVIGLVVYHVRRRAFR